MSENLITPEFRVSFPQLFRPKLNDLSKKLEYSVLALFPRDADLAAMKAAALALMEEKFGKDKAGWPEQWRNPFRDQSERKIKKNGVPVKDANGNFVLQPGHIAGAIFMGFKSEQRPGLVDQNRQPIIDETRIYSGCWMRAQVRPFFYGPTREKPAILPGIAFGLQNLQFIRDDDPLTGRQKAEDAFEAVAGVATAGADAGDPFA